MPVTISNQRLGPVGEYSSKHPWDVFHPLLVKGGKMDLWWWAPAPSDLPTSSCSSTAVSVSSDRQQLAVTWDIIFWRPQRESSDYCPILWFWNFRPPGIGRQDWFGSGRRRLPRVFLCFLDDMIVFAGVFPVFRVVFPNTCSMFF